MPTQTSTMTVGGTELITATPADATDSPTSVNPGATPVWTVADPTVVSLAVNLPAGLTANMTALKVGSTSVTVAATDIDNNAFSTFYDVTVTPGLATHFDFTFGPES
jgi:hypothetical protein